MATEAFYRLGLVCSVCAFLLMFIAFATPYWYQSWTRVHSSFGNIGLWHVCLNGFIRPRDPIMKSYVGCWWIHSTEFSAIENKIQPVWFRFMQVFSIISLVMDLFGMAFCLAYLPEGMRYKLYKKRPRMFFIDSFLLLGSAFLVFLIALVFAEMSNDSNWMPRPWMNYLSWSYGLCVLSGFFASFAGISLFLVGLIFKDKEDHGDPGLTSAAEFASKKRELEKQDEMMRQQGSVVNEPVGPHGHYGSGAIYRHGPPAYPDKLEHRQNPSHYGSQQRFPPGPPSIAASQSSKAGSQSAHVGESSV